MLILTVFYRYQSDYPNSDIYGTSFLRILSNFVLELRALLIEKHIQRVDVRFWVETKIKVHLTEVIQNIHVSN